MKLIKDIARSLYTAVTPEAEQRSHALGTLTSEDQHQLAIAHFAKGVPLLIKSSSAYTRAVNVAQDLVVADRGASSFQQMCRRHVRRAASPGYFEIVALGQLIRSVTDLDEGEVEGGEAGGLMGAIRPVVEAALAEKSFVKRRSLVRAAIKEQVPGLDADQLSFAVELVLTIAPNSY